MVVDASALLAILFNEPRGQQCASELAKHPTGLLMSTVTMTEVLIRVMSRKMKSKQDILDKLREASIELVDVDATQAQLAADARLKYPLNLGDCFVYALAKSRGQPILTLDADFAKTDAAIVPV